MFRINTEKEFLAAFRPRDRKHVELPKGIAFPLFVRDYLAWSEPTGVRVFLLFSAPGERTPTGVAFRKNQSGEPGGTRLCEWCHLYGSSDQVALLTADVNSRKRVGISLCLDLRCGQKMEEDADRRGRNFRVEVKGLLERMARFSREALGISGNVREV